MKYTKIVTFLAFLALAVVARADNTWVKAKGGGWEPEATLLAAMKAGLKDYVKKEAKLQNRQLRGWNEYVFQYLAMEHNGKKSILVNALCGIRDSRELEDFRFISGGGSCYFSLTYDPEQKRFHDLFINGST